MKRLIGAAILALIGAIILLTGDRTGPITTGMATGLFAASLGVLIDMAVGNWRLLRLAISSVRYWNSDVRISASYLFRIKLNNRYLLVRGSRYRNQFQPVGGVYKTTQLASEKLSDWGAVTDSLIPFDAVSENDLRIRIKGKHLLPFIAWFESGRHRETSPWREFYEELVENDVLASTDFPYIYYNFIKRIIHPIRFSPHAGIQELLVADIIELLPTEKQVNALNCLPSTHDVRWVTADDIRRRGDAPGTPAVDPIAVTAEWTL